MGPVVAVVQARMRSGRLPGKVLLDVAGQPVLARVLNRVRRAKRLDKVVVATSIAPADEAVEVYCRTLGVPCERGSERDVLDRFLQAGRSQAAGVVVRITADCPLIDPELVDGVLARLLEAEGRLDYVSNTLVPRTFPRGLDAEAFTMATLERAAREAKAEDEREHVTPYIYRHPELFRLGALRNPEDLSHHRWTVDEPADLEFVRTVFSHFGNDTFSWRDLLEVLEERPEWVAINAAVRQRELKG